jgi:hypothetical protein
VQEQEDFLTIDDYEAEVEDDYTQQDEAIIADEQLIEESPAMEERYNNNVDVNSSVRPTEVKTLSSKNNISALKKTAQSLPEKNVAVQPVANITTNKKSSEPLSNSSKKEDVTDKNKDNMTTPPPVRFGD